MAEVTIFSASVFHKLRAAKIAVSKCFTMINIAGVHLIDACRMRRSIDVGRSAGTVRFHPCVYFTLTLFLALGSFAWYIGDIAIVALRIAGSTQVGCVDAKRVISFVVTDIEWCAPGRSNSATELFSTFPNHCSEVPDLFACS